MGVWAAVGNRRQVIAVVRYGMNITLILLVNDELGKISKEQRGDLRRVAHRVDQS
jgi:hypothetical protein